MERLYERTEKQSYIHISIVGIRGDRGFPGLTGLPGTPGFRGLVSKLMFLVSICLYKII